MKNLVIAISREFGSGGRLIGEKLSKELGISYYDKILLQLAAEKSGISPEFIERSEEQASSSFLFNLTAATVNYSNFFYNYDVPMSDKAFFAQAAVIKELADKESCVIVGRCADYVLRSHENCIKVFIYAARETRLNRLIKEYKISPNEAKDKLNKMDKGRANYYKHYTGETWGAVGHYDLCINSDKSGIDGAVKVIRAMVSIV